MYLFLFLNGRKTGGHLVLLFICFSNFFFDYISHECIKSTIAKKKISLRIIRCICHCRYSHVACGGISLWGFLHRQPPHDPPAGVSGAADSFLHWPAGCCTGHRWHPSYPLPHGSLQPAGLQPAPAPDLLQLVGDEATLTHHTCSLPVDSFLVLRGWVSYGLISDKKSSSDMPLLLYYKQTFLT